MNPIMKVKVPEYSWEFDVPFSKFLKSLFGENFERKYCKVGVYNLLKDGKDIYEIKLSEVRVIPESDGKVVKGKDVIINKIIEGLNDKSAFSYGGKFVYFKVAKWNMKAEIVKKREYPESGF
jgi:hypothetical protein